MNVIFLDIDGVLNSEEFLKKNEDEAIDRNNVSILKNIIDKTGAVIVMSSGWRFWLDENMMSKERYSQCLYDILCEFDIKLFGKTPDFSTEEMRTNKTFSYVKAKEIIAWLNEHEVICKYVVMDDFDLRNEEINSHLVRTNAEVGLTGDDAKRVFDMINQ